mmetsp:Transcript_17079/g.40662  ORF Transcript_17079/g.40662 Transcript_17079/m.40662 type:complete len:203 (-) Transcript_17079:767-1375(-)
MEAVDEGLALRRQLPVQSVVRHQVDVLDPILLGHGRDSPPRPKLDRSALAKGLLVHREGQAQVLLEVTIVALDEIERGEESLVERRQLVERAVFAEELGDEKVSQRHLERDAFVQALTKHAADELEEAQVVRVGELRGGRGAELLLRCLHEETPVGVEGARDRVLQKLLEHAGPVDACLSEAGLIDELDADGALELLGAQAT